ncbi:MAG: hypothetical protein Kow0089_23130 [Desulfobulbaceae bacterium]
MARPLRIEYPDAWYHVMNRGRRKEKIFLTAEDYLSFLQVLRETCDAWRLEVAAYCLMPNHYHLLVHTPEGNISRCMRHLNGVYTQRFNRRHEIDGQLFRGRYKAVLVDADTYLLEVLRYIHRNPLEAGLTDNLNDFPWSSHHGYISRAKKWDWLYKEFPLSMVSTSKNKQRSAYLDFVGEGGSEEIERFYKRKNLPSILGTDTFKEHLKDRFDDLIGNREIPGTRELVPSAGKIIDSVCAHFGITEKELMKSRRGRENLPRDLAIFLVRRHTRKTLAEVGDLFGITNYSTVSSAIERVKTRLSNNKNITSTFRKIEKKINKSQSET